MDGALSAYLRSSNHNKRFITIDLSQEKGIGLFYQLIEKSDVLLENFRASSAQKLGLSPEQILQRNPRMIVCSISGYGRTGPMSQTPGYDVAIQAMSGLMSITGPIEGPPSKVGVAVTDVLTGLYAAIAILACLHERQRSGHGYAIDLALLDCAVASQVNVAQAFLTSGVVPPRQGNAHLQIVPCHLFATSDGLLSLAVGNDGQYQKFCQAADRMDLVNERFKTNPGRVQHREELIPLIEGILREKSTGQWQSILSQAGVPHAPVQNYEELFKHPQAESRGLRVSIRDAEGNPVDLIASPFRIDGAQLPEPLCPPTLSQHTSEVLSSVLGLSDQEIQKLKESGAI